MIFSVVFLGYYVSAPSAGYTVYDAAGGVLTARTTSGVVSLGGNAFQVDITSPVNPSTLVWDDGLGVSAEPESYNGGATFSGNIIILQDDLIGG